MTTDLTMEAAQGFDWHRRPGPAGLPGMSPVEACPYLNTSPAAMAWHLGRYMAAGGMSKPDAGRDGIHVLTSRGDTFRAVLFEQGKPVNATATLFGWQDDNSFRELA